MNSAVAETDRSPNGRLMNSVGGGESVAHSGVRVLLLCGQMRSEGWLRLTVALFSQPLNSDKVSRKPAEVERTIGEQYDVIAMYPVLGPY